MNRVLTQRKLEWLVRARGTDLTVWPHAERAAALALLRSCPAARAVFAEALVEEEAPELDGAVAERMQAALRRSLAPVPLVWQGLKAAALVACVAVGCYLGTVPSESDAGSVDPFNSAQTVAIAALGS